MIQKYVFPAVALLSLILGYYQLLIWQEPAIGWIFFVLYLSAVGEWWLGILRRVLGISRSWPGRVLSYGAAFFLLGYGASILVVWYRLTPLIMWSIYVAVAVVSYLLFLGTRNTRVAEWPTDATHGLLDASLFSKRWILALLYVVLWAIALYLLSSSQSSNVILSAWQTIHPAYLPVFFILTLLLGVMTLSHYGVKAALFFVILHSILLSSYLPLSHTLPWGGDVWRHVGNEERLLRGESILPVLFGAEATWRSFASVSVPEAFVVPHKYAYGHVWGTSVLLSQTLSADILAIHRWMGPIVWGLLFPMIIYHLSSILFRSSRAAVFFAWLSFLPFALQKAGAFTLPVGFDLLPFLFVLFLWLRWSETKEAWQRNMAIGLSGLMVFGYTLYFLLILLIAAAVCARRRIKNYELRIMGLLAVVGMLFIPAIELLAGTSVWPQTVDWIMTAKRIVGEWSGWYYASQIRPHDIASGNILFNHTPLYAYVENAFTIWRWWVIPAMFFFWSMATYGFFRAWKAGRSSWQIMGILGMTVVAGYVIPWYFLAGQHLFARRLDPLLALLVVFFVVFAIQSFSRSEMSVRSLRAVAFFLILFFSWFATASYASGPDSQVVSRDEYAAAESVWAKISSSQGPLCVIADTWQLLALEGVSAGAIIGGGFPIDANFGQPERVRIFENILHDPSLLAFAHTITESQFCTAIFSADAVTSEQSAFLSALFRSQPQRIGLALVWEEGS